MPLASRARATCAASAINSLSFSRGVRFTKSPIRNEYLARPHPRHLKRPANESIAELLKNIAQRTPQIVGGSCSKARDQQPTHERHRTVAPEWRSHVAHQFETCCGLRAEINQRRNRGAIGQQRFATNVWQNVIGDAEAVRPDELSVFHDVPA